jgi:biotin transporter BioY
MTNSLFLVAYVLWCFVCGFLADQAEQRWSGRSTGVLSIPVIILNCLGGSYLADYFT